MKIFVWEPEKRLTPDQAFTNPWISDFIDTLKAKIKGPE